MTAQTQPEAMLPCPFCGGKALLDEDTGWKAVECEKCGMHGGVALEAGDAITEWNRRAPLDSQQERKPLSEDDVGLWVVRTLCAASKQDKYSTLRNCVPLGSELAPLFLEFARDHGITQEKQG